MQSWFICFQLGHGNMLYLWRRGVCIRRQCHCLSQLCHYVLFWTVHFNCMFHYNQHQLHHLSDWQFLS